jgi:DNA polymerase III subunit delta'
MDWQTFGHQRVKKILERQIQTGVFPHAYLFRGSEGVGKKTLALEFAQKILETESLHNHPDFCLLDLPDEITIDLALEFIGQLSLKPFIGKKKIAVINNAQNLNSSSGNALLKNLEEASLSTIIILIANSHKLLPTIVSRCQVLAFSLFSAEELQQFAGSKKMGVTDEILELSFGRPARLKRLIEDKEFYIKQKSLIERYKGIVSQKLGEKFLNVTELGQAETVELRESLLLWTFWQTAKLPKFPEEYVKVQALAEAWNSLYLNKNKKLLLQTLFQKI